MCIDEDAAARASRIADRLGIEGDPDLSSNGWSNHVWLYRDAVIRLAARVGCGSLAVEAEIVPRLPAAVGYPRILGTGMIDGYEWMALERLPGDNLATVRNRCVLSNARSPSPISSRGSERCPIPTSPACHCPLLRCTRSSRS